jgi:hypothetical protein
MDHYFFAYCPLSYDGEFYPEPPPGCALTPLFPASPGMLLCICHIMDQLLLDTEFDHVQPYLVGERLHRLLHSALRWPPALALARVRASQWEADHLGLDQFEQRLTPVLQQCMERQNRVPAQLLPSRVNNGDLRRGEYYWVLQGGPGSRWVRWVSSDFRLCEGPPDLFAWPAAANPQPSSSRSAAPAGARSTAAPAPRPAGAGTGAAVRHPSTGTSRPAPGPAARPATGSQPAPASPNAAAGPASRTPLGPPPNLEETARAVPKGHGNAPT